MVRELAINRSRVRIPAAALPSASCLHTIVPLSLSSIIWGGNVSLLPGLWLRSPAG